MKMVLLAVVSCVLPVATAAVVEDCRNMLPRQSDLSAGHPCDYDGSASLSESHVDAHFLDGSFDTLLAVKEADGSSFLHLTDDGYFQVPALGAEGTSQIQETVVDGPLLSALLTLNGLDHSLLALSRMDASLLGATGSADEDPARCNKQACRETCLLHNCPGGYCDRLRRCRCFAVNVAGRRS